MTEPPGGDPWEVGEAYETYMGRWSRLVARDFVAWLARPPGGRWLDVGCGTGALSGAICELADPATVAGVDPSAGFVARATERSCAGRADVRVADAAGLPFDADTFDTVVSGLVLNFVPEPVAALREQARVVGPSGTVASYVWDDADGMRMLRHSWDAARRVTPAAASLDEAARFPDATPAGLARTFDAAGLYVTRSTALEVEMRFADLDELWRPFLSGQGPAPGFVAGLDDGERAALRADLAATVPGADGGPIRLTARAWAISAEARGGSG